MKQHPLRLGTEFGGEFWALFIGGARGQRVSADVTGTAARVVAAWRQRERLDRACAELAHRARLEASTERACHTNPKYRRQWAAQALGLHDRHQKAIRQCYQAIERGLSHLSAPSTLIPPTTLPVLRLTTRGTNALAVDSRPVNALN